MHAWCIRGERACPKPSAAAAAAAAAALTASPSATATATAATCPPCPRRHRRRRREPPTWAAHPCQVRSGRTVGAGCSSCCGASRRSEGRRTSGRTAIGSRAAAVAGGVSTDSEIRAPEIIAGEDRRADITVRKEIKSAVHLFVLMASEFKDGRKEGEEGAINGAPTGSEWHGRIGASAIRVCWSITIYPLCFSLEFLFPAWVKNQSPVRFTSPLPTSTWEVGQHTCDLEGEGGQSVTFPSLWVGVRFRIKTKLCARRQTSRTASRPVRDSTHRGTRIR